ncbi:MAG TPA: gliding motility-associated C-terminal domain-containing protein [Flavobacteriales bacterium]
MRNLLAWLPLLFSGALTAQNGSWFFGFGGSIVFENGTITTPSGALFTEEGCASQCDADGQPLFFTNGEVVIDRNGNQMPNGFGLSGSFSSTQSALAVPFPDDPDRYYIFTTPAMVGAFSPLGITGLAYSVVDMTLNNGLGAVTDKNIVLFDNVTEKLTATRHANGRDVWVVAHEWNSDRYAAFLVGCSGVQGPVISPAGRVMQFLPGPDAAIPLYASVGAMDISPDGSTIASTWATVQDGNINGMSFLDILHFNDTTGQVGDGIAITHGGPGTDVRGYGLAFSAQGSKLYQTQFAPLGFPGQGLIRQYDMTATDVAGSEFMVTQDLPELGLVQSAPDGSMLVAILLDDGIAGITAPEQAGAACGFIPELITLSAGSSMWGLPNDWDTGARPIDPLDPLGLQDTTIQCSDTLWIDLGPQGSLFDPATVVWSHGATGERGAITAPGEYSVTVRTTCDTITDAFTVSGTGDRDLLPDQLRGCSDAPVELHVPMDLADVFWSTMGTENTITVDADGVYSVIAFDTLGCRYEDTVSVVLENCHCRLFLPNAFTPDGDGLNDTWKAGHSCTLDDFRLTVFDRWGLVAFSTEDPEQSWSGAASALPNDVYVYRVQYAFWNGAQREEREASGTVTVVR